MKHLTEQEIAAIPQVLLNFVSWFISRHNIRGICDPMYVANLTAYEIGWGNGCGTFCENLPAIQQVRLETAARRLFFSYSTCVTESNGNADEILKNLVATFV